MTCTSAKVVNVAAGSLLAFISITGVRAGAATPLGARPAQTDATTEPPATVTTPRDTRPPREPTRGTGSTPQPTVAATTPPTTAASTTTSSSSTPWALIVVVIVAIVVIMGVVLLASRRRRGRAMQQGWRADAASALRDAELTRDMLESEARSDQPDDAPRHDALRGSVEVAALHFEQLSRTAPTDTSGQNARRVANALRGYLFALEAERLLRTSATPPTAEQLAEADSARRGRATDLEAALAAIRVSVSSSR